MNKQKKYCRPNILSLYEMLILQVESDMFKPNLMQYTGETLSRQFFHSFLAR